MKLAAAVFIVLALPAQAQMYKCVDAKGATRYGDQAGPGCQPVAIRPSPPISGAVKARDENFAVKDAELKRRLLERDDAQAKTRAAEEERCASLRRENTILSSGVPIRHFNDKGEAVFMEDAVRDARRAELAQALRECR